MKIEWTEPAIADLESIRDYIKRDSEYYADRFVEKIIEAIEKLEKFPEIGRTVPESEMENIRELLFHNYRIMYRKMRYLLGLKQWIRNDKKQDDLHLIVKK